MIASHFLLLYALALPTLLLLDGLWLGVIARGLYQARMGALLGPVVLIAAIAFYLLYCAGLVFFAAAPAAAKHSVLLACGLGAFFGCVCYATYDLTALSVIKGFDPLLALLDIAWGALAGAVTAGVAVYLLRFFVS
jgi:uncharacterized membrane protein